MAKGERKKTELFHRLEGIFGETRVSGTQTVRELYSRDQWTRLHMELRRNKAPAGPDFVVWPETVQEISELLRLANKQGFPVVPMGGGAGVTGGSLSGEGAVVMDLKRMNRVLDVNGPSLLVTAEAGILCAHFEHNLRKHGYTLGHFPASMNVATLGGMLSTRSVGQAVSRYGRIEDMVASLLAVLPDGSMLRTRNAPRSATGPDIKQVLLGTEGTLAVIAQATLRIEKQPEAIHARALRFGDMDSGAKAMREVLHAGTRPAVLRLHDEDDTERLARLFGGDFEAGGCLLLVTTEGNHRMAEVQMEVALSACLAAGGEDQGEEPARLWLRRRYSDQYLQSPSLADKTGVFDIVDTGAAWKNVIPLYRNVKKALDKHGRCRGRLVYPTRDGCCVSFTVRDGGSRKRDTRVYDMMWRDAMDAALASGGTISHHRGVGLARAAWMEQELGPAMDLFRELKGRLDPNGILNPGKQGLNA